MGFIQVTRLIALAVLFFAAVSDGALADGGKTLDDNVNSDRIDEVATGDFDIIRYDAGWCGPRLLYFFCVYQGRDVALPEVLGMCQLTTEGMISLDELTVAAAKLALEPRCVKCSLSQLIETGGPAIIVTGDTGTPDHVIGYLGFDGDRYIIVDPSTPTESVLMTFDQLHRRFHGEAILLKGAKYPEVNWLDLDHVSLIMGVVGGLGVLFWAVKKK
jgi:hypothetical protein